jgi:hypothetical protein
MILRLPALSVAIFLLLAWLTDAELHGGGVPKHANRPNEKATRISVTDDATLDIYQVRAILPIL